MKLSVYEITCPIIIIQTNSFKQMFAPLHFFPKADSATTFEDVWLVRTLELLDMSSCPPAPPIQWSSRRNPPRNRHRPGSPPCGRRESFPGLMRASINNWRFWQLNSTSSHFDTSCPLISLYSAPKIESTSSFIFTFLCLF